VAVATGEEGYPVTTAMASIVSVEPTEIAPPVYTLDEAVGVVPVVSLVTV
jgi:hypothetical protein